MKKTCLFLLATLFAHFFIPEVSAQRSERIYQRAIKHVNNDAYLKAGNTFLKAHDKNFFPAFRALSMASASFDAAGYDDEAKTFALDAEKAASQFYYIMRKYVDDSYSVEGKPMLKGPPLYDSLYYTLIPLLTERAFMHAHYEPAMLLYALTASLYSNENYDSCILYANIALRYQDDAEFAIYKGNAYMAQSSGDSALLAYTTAMKLDPGNTEAITGVGEAYEMKEDFDAARKFYELAAARDTSNLYAKYSLALLHLQEKRYTQALESLKSLVQEHPSYYFPYFDIGGIYFDFEKYPEAIEAYEKFLEWEPGNEDAIYNIKAAKYNMEQEFLY